MFCTENRASSTIHLVLSISFVHILKTICYCCWLFVPIWEPRAHTFICSMYVYYDTAWPVQERHNNNLKLNVHTNMNVEHVSVIVVGGAVAACTSYEVWRTVCYSNQIYMHKILFFRKKWKKMLNSKKEEPQRYYYCVYL